MRIGPLYVPSPGTRHDNRQPLGFAADAQRSRTPPRTARREALLGTIAYKAAVSQTQSTPLEPGEKIVWQSRGGGPAGWSQWVYVVGVLVGLHLCGTLAFIPIAFLGATSSSSYDDRYGDAYGGMDDDPYTYGAAEVPRREPSIGETILATLPSLLCTLISFGLAGAAGYVVIRPRLRPSYFLTPKRVIAHKLFGGEESWALSNVREMRQYIAVYRGRYGSVQEVATNRVQIKLASNAWVTVGPIADMQGLLDLYEHAIGTRWIELDALPAVGGALAPGESRADLLFIGRTKTTGMSYGPLFVGPTRIVRFTEVLEAHQLGRLYTVLGREGTPEEIEELIVSTARGGNFGHFVDVARDEARPAVDGRVLSLRLGERAEPIDVSEADADRARRFFAKKTPFRG